MIEGLSKLISKARDEGKLSSIKFSNDIIISHLLFVDDVILFRLDNIKEWKIMHTLLDLFCNATVMEVNIEKSCSYIHKIHPNCLLELKTLF